eukprot:1139994-Pelagomonas_calceolata.AAC.4
MRGRALCRSVLPFNGLQVNPARMNHLAVVESSEKGPHIQKRSRACKKLTLELESKTLPLSASSSMATNTC